MTLLRSIAIGQILCSQILILRFVVSAYSTQFKFVHSVHRTESFGYFIETIAKLAYTVFYDSWYYKLEYVKKVNVNVPTR